MKSLTIASFVSALYALWLSNYIAEGATVVIKAHELEKLASGSLDIPEININNGIIDSIAVDIKGEIASGVIMCDMRITDKNDETMYEQKQTDFCSLAPNEYIKPIFEELSKAGMNTECPYDSGSFKSDKINLNVDGAPAGDYTLIVELFEAASVILRVTVDLEVQE